MKCGDIIYVPPFIMLWCPPSSVRIFLQLGRRTSARSIRRRLHRYTSSSISIQNTKIIMKSSYIILRPNHNGVKYSLIVQGGGGAIGPCLCFDLLIGQKLSFFFRHFGSKKEIHPFWLRERINGDTYVDKNTQQRLFDPTKIRENIKQEDQI